MAEKDKTLTTKFTMEMMAEFKAAVEILGARSINAMVHQMVSRKILEAKKLVSDEEFQEIYEEQVKSIKKRSRKKSKERKDLDARVKIIGEIDPKAGKKKRSA